MESLSLHLLVVHSSLAAAIPMLDNGMGEKVSSSASYVYPSIIIVIIIIKVSGPESVVNNYAVLSSDNLGTLPEDITICSSIATRAFLGFMSPFQLLYENGKPWITVRTDLALKHSTLHRIIFYVRSSSF